MSSRTAKEDLHNQYVINNSKCSSICNFAGQGYESHLRRDENLCYIITSNIDFYSDIDGDMRSQDISFEA